MIWGSLLLGIKLQWHFVQKSYQDWTTLAIWKQPATADDVIIRRNVTCTAAVTCHIFKFSFKWPFCTCSRLARPQNRTFWDAACRIYLLIFFYLPTYLHSSTSVNLLKNLWWRSNGHILTTVWWTSICRSVKQLAIVISSRVNHDHDSDIDTSTRC